MGADEKVRTSGEVMRPEASAPVLPVTNPAVAPKPAQSGLHPSVYITYVHPAANEWRNETRRSTTEQG